MNSIQWAGTLIGGAGFIIFGVTAGWLPAFGLLLALWGYGLQLADNLKREGSSGVRGKQC